MEQTDKPELKGKTAQMEAIVADRKRPRLRDPRRNPITVLETLVDLAEMIELAKKASADAGRNERDRYKFQRIEAWAASEEAIAKARLEKDG